MRKMRELLPRASVYVEATSGDGAANDADITPDAISTSTSLSFFDLGDLAIKAPLGSRPGRLRKASTMPRFASASAAGADQKGNT